MSRANALLGTCDMEIIGYQYASVKKSNGHVTGKVWDHPLWLQLMLDRDERLARRCELLTRPIYAGEWDKANS